MFLTGRAGTGKTTFLREIIQHTHKKTIIAAPTGVAAINAGGVTLHSLFQLPFGTYVPSDQYTFEGMTELEVHGPRTLMKSVRMHANKRRMIREMELLIIDEVSMLRADMLDAIDRVLQSVRRKRGVPFGGIQLLFIGDLLQLPPVVKEEEWAILRNYYRSIHFFEAKVLQSDPPLYLELEKIYRQSDPEFIRVLNHFRDGKVTREDVELLNRHSRPGFRPRPDEGFIYLTTHNRIADRINQDELGKLKGEIFTYSAEIEKDFRDYQYPVETDLQLKVGAQVMFIKNDTTADRRFFNGKIGVISELDEEGIEVGFNDGSDPVWVEKHVWYNKRYKLDSFDNEIKEEIMGSFTQYPLKLAWAVTVHKSQGLTFEKAIIDVEHAFAPGQIYVALSRLVGLEGLVLSSPVPTRGFSPDSSIRAFSDSKQNSDELDRLLEQETHKYLKLKLLQYFDLGDLHEALKHHLASYIKDGKRSAKQRFLPRMQELEALLKPELAVSERFRMQVLEICKVPGEGYLMILQKRVDAASDYFVVRLEKLSGHLQSLIEELSDAVGVKGYLKELRELDSMFSSRVQVIRKAQVLVEAVRTNKELKSQ